MLVLVLVVAVSSLVDNGDEGDEGDVVPSASLDVLVLAFAVVIAVASVPSRTISKGRQRKNTEQGKGMCMMCVCVCVSVVFGSTNQVTAIVHVSSHVVGTWLHNVISSIGSDRSDCNHIDVDENSLFYVSSSSAPLVNISPYVMDDTIDSTPHETPAPHCYTPLDLDLFMIQSEDSALLSV